MAGVRQLDRRPAFFRPRMDAEERGEAVKSPLAVRHPQHPSSQSSTRLRMMMPMAAFADGKDRGGAGVAPAVCTAIAPAISAATATGSTPREAVAGACHRSTGERRLSSVRLPESDRPAARPAVDGAEAPRSPALSRAGSEVSYWRNRGQPGPESLIGLRRLREETRPAAQPRAGMSRADRRLPRHSCRRGCRGSRLRRR